MTMAVNRVIRHQGDECCVPYTAVYYHADSDEIMKRLQAEFFKALQLLAERQKQESDAQLLTFPDSKSKQSH